MIERKTIVDTIEIHRDGSVGIRLGLLLVEDGVEIDCKWHRTMIAGGVTPEQQMAAVNEHLAAMGKEPVGPEELDFIRKTHGFVEVEKPQRPDIAKRGAPDASV